MLRDTTVDFIEAVEAFVPRALLAGADCSDQGIEVEAEVDAFLVAARALVVAVVDRAVALRCGRAEPI